LFELSKFRSEGERKEEKKGRSIRAAFKKRGRSDICLGKEREKTARLTRGRGKTYSI